MSYNMIITRRMGFAGPATADVWQPPVDGRHQPFTILGETVLKGEGFAAANRAVLEHIRAIDANAREDVSRIDRNALDDPAALFSRHFVFPPDIRAQRSYTLGQLPSRRIYFEMGAVDWVMRTRAAFSPCPLREKGGIAKFFWTCEGIPVDPDPERRLTRQEAAAFSRLAMQIEDVTMPALHAAYTAAVAEVTGKADELPIDPLRLPLLGKQARIVMADAVSCDIDHLIDIMRFSQSGKPSDIRKAPADISYYKAPKSGLSELTRFTLEASAGRVNVNDDTVSVSAKDYPATEGVICTEVTNNITEIVGLTPQGVRTTYDHLASVRAERRSENEENRLRRSAKARPLSASILERIGFSLMAKPGLPRQQRNTMVMKTNAL